LSNPRTCHHHRELWECGRGADEAVNHEGFKEREEIIFDLMLKYES
jgi:hypothetical protein